MKLGDICTLQFELWQNCNNGCKFCYLNGYRIISTPEQQISDIEYVRNIINSDKLNNYNAIGLIGGEFFQGQLSDIEVKKHWLLLMKDIAEYLRNNTIKEFWITCSLMSEDLSDLFESIDIFPKDKKILISTSYDEIGRFNSEKIREIWFKNIEVIHNKYPNAVVHTQTIATQSLIDHTLKDYSFIREILKYSTMDFKLPAVFRKDYSKLNPLNEYTYHDLLLRTADQFPKGFFIEHRDDFLNFLRKIINIFGVEKLQWFCRNEVRSKTLYIVPKHIIIEDRWDINSIGENAKCGHVYDSYCYLDSDKCARCDAMKLYEEIA